MTTSFLVAHDPWFYVAAVVAVLILGIAKGGFAGGIGLVAVPLLSLTTEPARAPAILLPLLMLMDVTALRPYWGLWDWRSIWTTAPGAVLGTGIGFATFDLLSQKMDKTAFQATPVAFFFGVNWL